MNPVSHFFRVFFFAGAGLIAALMGFAAEAASVSGRVSVDRGKNLKNLIVYLEPANAAARAANGEALVRQKGRVFRPGLTVIVQGGKVGYINDEEKNIDHNIYSLSKIKKFDLGLLGKGKRKDVEFTKSGTVKYYCSVHKNMEGTVVVVPSPFYALLKKPGAFSIDNVPAGDWVVKTAVSHRRYAATPVPVSVSGDVGDITVSIGRKKRRGK